MCPLDTDIKIYEPFLEKCLAQCSNLSESILVQFLAHKYFLPRIHLVRMWPSASCKWFCASFDAKGETQSNAANSDSDSSVGSLKILGPSLSIICYMQLVYANPSRLSIETFKYSENH